MTDTEFIDELIKDYDAGEMPVDDEIDRLMGIAKKRTRINELVDDILVLKSHELLAAKVERYEKALKEIIKEYDSTIKPEHEFSVCELTAREALEDKE